MTATATPTPTQPSEPKPATAAPAASLIAGALVVPLVFWIGTEESFIIPKLVTATVVTVVAAVQLGRARVGEALQTLRLHRVDLAVAAWIALVAASFLTSVDQGQSWWGEIYQRQGLFTSLLYATGFLLARLTIGDQHRLRLLMRSIAVAATATAAYGIIQRLGLDPLWDDIPDDRVFSTIGQTNSLGAFLALSIPVTVGLALTAGRRPTLYLAGAALQAAALAATVSRGGFLGLAVSLALLAVFALGHRGWEPPAAIGLVAAAGMGLLIVFTITPGLESSTGRVLNRAVADEEWSSGSIRNHLDLWTIAGHVVADHPVLGSGPDTFPLVFGDYRDDVLSADSAARLRPFRVESPHNIVAATAAGSGLPAAIAQVIAMLGAAVVALRTGWVRRGEASSLLHLAVGTALIGAFCASMFITADFPTTWLVWLLSGAALSTAAGRVERAGVSPSPQARPAPDPG